MPKLKYILMLGVAACALRTGAMESGEEVDPVGVPAAAPVRAMADPEAEEAPAANVLAQPFTLQFLPDEMPLKIAKNLPLRDIYNLAETNRRFRTLLIDMEKGRIKDSVTSTQLDANARLFANKMIACPEGIASDVRQLISHKPSMKDYGVEKLMRIMGPTGSLILKNNHPLMAAMRHQAGIARLSLVETVAEALTGAGQALSSFDKAILQHKFAPYTIFQRDGAGPFRLERFNAAAFKSLKATYYEVPTEGNITPVPMQTNLVVSLETLGLRGRKEALEVHFGVYDNRTLIIDVANDLTELTLGAGQLPQTVKNLAITNSGGRVTAIEDWFLPSCLGLTAVDFAGLSNVTLIGNGFLSDCLGLTAVDLTGLSNVTEIGNGFLSASCLRRAAVDLAGLSNVTLIGHGFLSCCTGLTAVDLAGLSNVTLIGNGFLSSCPGLTAVDLAGLANVTLIGDRFLNGCTGLTALDLTPLSNVTKIRGSFLESCTGMTALNLSPLSNVTEIGDSFLSRCTGLTALDLAGLANVTEIGDSFLSRCTGLTALDLASLPNLTKIGDSFLRGCDALQRLIAPKHLRAQLEKFAYLSRDNSMG